jgi:hypothetical protein
MEIKSNSKKNERKKKGKSEGANGRHEEKKEG